MKNLLSKDHYCYKSHTLLMNSRAYLHTIDNHPIESKMQVTIFPAINLCDCRNAQTTNFV